jgi:hypothetical protein
MKRKLLLPIGTVIIVILVMVNYYCKNQNATNGAGQIEILNEEIGQVETQQDKEVHPILSWSHRIIGGTIDGKYADAETIAGLISDGEEYSLYSMTDYLGRYKGSIDDVRFSNGDYYIEFDSQKEAAFGVLGSWNALPRIPGINENNVEEYGTLIKELLSKKGLENVAVNITRVLTVDIEGDGKEETFIVAGNFSETDHTEISDGKFQGADSKYSIIVMLKNMDGNKKSIVIKESYKDLHEYNINYLADVDGDGVIELSVNELDMNAAIIEAEGYPISTDRIYEIMGDRFIEVLSVDSSPI